MNQRLQQFLSAENISQAQFADSIGVARASVSHILAGRNKPGFDFIESMARKYPNVSMEWVITGKGRMYKGADSPAAASSKSSDDMPDFTLFEQPQQEEKTPAPIVVESPVKPSVPKVQPAPAPQEKPVEKPQPIRQDSPKARSISRIIVFYDDNTYQELK